MTTIMILRFWKTTLGNQCRPRPDCSVWSGSPMLARLCIFWAHYSKFRIITAFFEVSKFFKIWAMTWQNHQSGCAPSEDSDRLGHLPSLISLRCPHEESSGPYLPIEQTAKTLIRLGGCPGWSESSLGAPSFCWFCHVAAHFKATYKSRG